MNCYATRRLHSVLFRRIKRQDQLSYSFKKCNRTREFSSSLLNRYCYKLADLSDAKYGEIRSRLAEIPCQKMLEREEDRLRHDLCYEKDEVLRGVLKWFEKVFDYNARTSRKVGAAALLKAYCTYGFSMDDSSWDKWDSDKWRSAVILAWCVELLQVCHNILDDLVEQSALRKGEPCWYTKPDVGPRATIDALFLHCGIHQVLRKYFADSKCYKNVFHEFFQSNHYTVVGQSLDMMFKPKNRRPRFDMFTLEKYLTQVEYKTVYCTFILPVNVAMHLAGECSTKEFEFTRKLCIKLGTYFQIQDDFIDCFEETEVTGEIPDDIAKGRCTWVAVKFLEVASEAMRKQFFENYGVDDEDAIANVMELYRKANLLEIYKEFEANLSEEIRFLIEAKNDTKGAFFYDMFARIQKLHFI